uniref:Uncharacterized protein n=2 Tax=Candidatus Kentrum sp. FM TaxID=2126340 RepID=A0A450SU02_9GAMM|nr:MAG: hypothetical protein BECKFM1743A_GA0114220_101894 [Candidatus Kentron sp. FM]
MALFDMIDALRDSGLTSILPIPLWVPARPGWDSCSWPGLGEITRRFTTDNLPGVASLGYFV